MACDIFYFVRSETYPGGIGSLDEPFLIAEGSLGNTQMQIIMEGIDAIYEDMGPGCEPEYVLLASEEVSTAITIYKIVSDIYGQASRSIETAFDETFFGLDSIIDINDPDVKMELLGIFRDTYESFEPLRIRNLLPATKTLNRYALNVSGESSINDFLMKGDIKVDRDWAVLSGIGGYPIDEAYIV